MDLYDNIAPNTGEGPYRVERDEADSFYYIWNGAERLDKAFPLGKTAYRRCRDLNANLPVGKTETATLEPPIDPEDDIAEVLHFEPEPSAEELQRPEDMERFPSVVRHAWLEDAGQYAAKLLRERTELEVPHTIRVSLGWPRGRKSIGECWHAVASKDGHREIFVSPVLDDPDQIVATLIHEMIHASLPDDAKHGPLFAKPARAVGLEGKLTATHAGDELAALISQWVLERGAYPAAGLDPGARLQKKQGTRLLKACCPSCGYTIRVTKVWADRSLPVCAECEEPFELQ